MIAENAVRAIRGVNSLFGFLRDELGWPLPDETTLDEVTFEWDGEELKLSESVAVRLKDGRVRQLRPFHSDQPWGIFLVEFNDSRVYRTALRQVLRGLVPSRRRDPSLRAWHHPNLLFVCTTVNQQFTFAHFRGEKPQRAKLITFSWSPDDPIRTLCEFCLPALQFPSDRGADSQKWLAGWQTAFDVEKVTEEFFRLYRELFKQVEESIRGVPEGEPLRMFTQMLLNRLMFIYFLQKKGWLDHSPRYLHNLFEVARAEASGHGRIAERHNFYDDYLHPLFFWALNTPLDVRLPDETTLALQQKLGDVPFLNGGLFEKQPECDFFDDVHVPNSAFAAIFDLFGRFNFTVTESTPLDIEVAVDPEMLGRIFEELVTGRHETGSYYTPKPVVAFMCREALKGYLATTLPAESANAISQFVDEHNPAGLRNPEAVLEALRRVKVCDPACGSGAYLLGMLHELIDLRACLFASHHLDPLTVYERKLEIIQNNLYGVDIDLFAVNIARLRLWLSLMVDFEGDDPPPLPNLDFKIEVGDSLTAPDPSAGGTQFGFREHQIKEYFRLKTAYMTAHGDEKRNLREQIAALKRDIALWAHEGRQVTGFDWPVEFAEVFTDGGFDIVLANPPYLRQEVVKRQFGDTYKANLVRLYPEVYVSTADIYVAFFARTQQLLKPDGIGCFISSNKWLRAGYGEKLRQHLLDAQAFHLVVDFGELPVFQAATFPAIFLWQKQPREDTPTTWAVVKNLGACYDEGIREHIDRISQTVPASQFGKGKPRLASLTAAGRRTKMEASGQRLGELVKGQIYRGIITGLNEAFVIDRATRDRLIAEDPKSVEILKPLLVGDDVRRYESHFRETYLIWTYIGVPIKQYPAVFAHLKKFQSKAEKRWDQGNHWWELRACDYYDAFDRLKIIYPEIAKEPRFGLDTEQFYPLKTIFSIALGDWYLLGVLNSAPAWDYLKGTCCVLGDEDRGGRLTLQAVYIETLPIPHAPTSEREAVAKLAQEAQRLHTKRRKRVEQFLLDIGLSPAESRSRNPLEQPWTLTPDQLRRRCSASWQLALQVRDETAALTEQIEQVERQIDKRVAGLYGVELADVKREE